MAGFAGEWGCSYAFYETLFVSGEQTPHSGSSVWLVGQGPLTRGSRLWGGMTWGTFGHTQYGQVLSPCVTVVPGLCHIPAALGVHAAAQPP